MNDTDHVRNLLGRYCERIDAGDFEGVGALFARGGLAAGDGEPFVSGSRDVAAFYEGGTQRHDGTPRTKHVVADTVFEEPSADGTVTARSSYVVFQGLEGFPLQPIIAGRYVDSFGRDGTATDHERDGGWHFVVRRFHVDLVGDLSRHLVQPDLAGPAPVPSNG